MTNILTKIDEVAHDILTLVHIGDVKTRHDGTEHHRVSSIIKFHSLLISSLFREKVTAEGAIVDIVQSSRTIK